MARRAGFTIIELMIAVGIIATLAAITIPRVQRFQLRSRAAEGRINLAGLRTAQESYFAEYNTYLAAAQTPADAPEDGPVAWPSGSDFEALGWMPEGAVGFRYAVTVLGAAPPYLGFTAESFSDLDRDGLLNLWGYVKPDEVGTTVAGAWGCPDTGVWNAIDGTLTSLETVGPCDSESGASVF